MRTKPYFASKQAERENWSKIKASPSSISEQILDIEKSVLVLRSTIGFKCSQKFV